MRAATQKDEQLQCMRRLIKEGWPERECNIPHSVKDFYAMKDSLSVCEGLITIGCRIVVPQSMREEILDRLHQGCPTFFDPRSTFQVANLPRSTIPVSTLQTHTHHFQPAVTNLTTPFLVVTQPLDITSQTLPLSHTHTHEFLSHSCQFA